MYNTYFASGLLWNTCRGGWNHACFPVIYTRNALLMSRGEFKSLKGAIISAVFRAAMPRLSANSP